MVKNLNCLAVNDFLSTFVAPFKMKGKNSGHHNGVTPVKDSPKRGEKPYN